MLEEKQGLFAKSQNETPADARQNFAVIGSSHWLWRSAPLRLERINGALLMMGNNQKPLGRKLNRRLEMELYYPLRSLTSLK